MTPTEPLTPGARERAMNDRLDAEPTKADVDELLKDLGLVREQMAEVIVGQTEVIDAVLVCLLAGGHALLEGVPGVGKTLLVRTLAQVLGLEFSRIQFTPDLMPADITGTTVLFDGPDGKRTLEFRKGPVFAQVVLADEINRATPKTQSALLEAMQEHHVTVGGRTFPIDPPHFILATQNPVEMEGTYPLPEAQLDRFLFKIDVPFPSREELVSILERTTHGVPVEPRPVMDGPRLLAYQRVARRVPVAEPLRDYVVRLVRATHPDLEGATPSIRRFVRLGASPRGAQALLLGAKIRALLLGRFAPGREDVKHVANWALRHRILLSFEGEAENIRPQTLIEELVDSLAVPS